MKRPWLFAAMAALGLSCAMPEIPEGYQLQCSEDAECPEGTSCSQLCCLKPGETPTCRVVNWRPSSVGGPCTNDKECAQGLRCLSEAAVGPVGGLCTHSCSSEGCNQPDRCQSIPVLAAAAGLASSDFCVPQCSSDGRNCRPGFRCACDNNYNCGCVPGCNQSGDGACDDSGSARSCDAGTGLCTAIY